MVMVEVPSILVVVVTAVVVPSAISVFIVVLPSALVVVVNVDPSKLVSVVDVDVVVLASTLVIVDVTVVDPSVFALTYFGSHCDFKFFLIRFRCKRVTWIVTCNRM